MHAFNHSREVNMKLEGTITAMVTPFIDQKLDLEGLITNIRFQIASGVDGILLLGTTGEVSTLTQTEKEQVITTAVQEANGRVPVWIGTGSYSTQQTIENTKVAKNLGANGALVVTPYYNKPTQEGIYRHFEALSNAVDIPIMLYNIPGRCGINVETATMLRIANLPNIVGVKEASGLVQQAGEVFYEVCNKYPNFKIFSGDDILTLPMMSLGAVGVISVVSNLIPHKIVALTKAALKGDFGIARQLHFELLPLYKAAFFETNPIPIKAAMEICGMPAGDCRLPLCKISDQNMEKLQLQLKQLNITH